MKELVIISGKGGTGKTSVTAAFAALAQHAVLVDADVDAADLHLVLAPTIEETHDFFGGRQARILTEACQACGSCANVCRFSAVQADAAGYRIDPLSCEGCGVCAHLCPYDAIAFEETCNGQWFRSTTRFGPLVHARLGIAEENSGKLVALVRREARTLADAMQADVLLVDGPPGIGCPVISSLSGADHAVIVTEPTVAGRHDLERVLTLATHFQVPASILINKADLYPAGAAEIEQVALARQIPVLGRLPYDPVVTQALLVGQSVIEYADSPISQALRDIWTQLDTDYLKE
jgi:MinD superfamily P-loop ATPase